jgi:c-di-GMP-binding flagellar brake protein YcgR
MEERRRTQRFDVAGEQRAVLPVAMSVRLLDISAGGVLVHAGQPTTTGTRGHVRFDLAGEPFAADVEVRRIAQGPGGQGYKIGARFVDLTDDQRAIIDRFTTR